MRLITFLLALFLFSCNQPAELTVCTFNIKWLGDGINDNISRSGKDYNNIASVISSLDADIIALQEIENRNAIQKILDTNQHAVYTSSYPKEQKTALVIDKKIDVLEVHQLDEIALGNNDLRPGLVAYCEYNGYDFFVGSFHFKATSRHDNTPVKRTRSFDMRQDQSKYLISSIKKLINEKNDSDVILLGDFNDSPAKDNSNILALDNDDFDFITSDLKSCKYPRLKSIDHIIVSQSVKENVKKESLHMLDLSRVLRGDELRIASDHCPISVSININ
jgi:endonuclease/exonuclease/phosphatase family metal-dependent hydrolase